MKNTEMLEWMSGIDSEFLNEAEQPVIRKHTRKRLPVMIAAAAAAFCMAAGAAVYAGVRYHSASVAKYFGSSGEEFITGQPQYEPVTYTCDTGSVTLEGVFNDGINAIAVLRAELNEGEFNYEYDIYAPLRILDADGNDICGQGQIRMTSTMTSDTPSSREVSFITELGNIGNYLGQTVYLDYPEASEFDPSIERQAVLGGISVPVTLNQNVQCGRFCAEDGTELLLSDFEAVQLTDQSAEITGDGMLNTGADRQHGIHGSVGAGYQQNGDEPALMTLRFRDGSEKALYRGCWTTTELSGGTWMNSFSLFENQETGDSAALNQQFMDTSAVTEIVIGDKRYFRQ